MNTIFEIANLEKILTNNSKQLLDSKVFPRMKESSEYQPLLSEIHAEANRLLAEPIEELSYSLFQLYEKQGTRIEYEKAYFEKRRRLNTFAIMSLMEPENSAYTDALQEIIWSICNEYTWCLPAHFSLKRRQQDYSINVPMLEEETIDLFAAETGFALAEILSLTKELLAPFIRKRIRQEIYRRIFWPYQHQKPFFWERATHNWASVCAGSIGAAALHMIDDAEELATIIERVLTTMDYYLSGFQDDGACLEGYGYWEYGFGFFVYFADLLKNKTEGRIDLFQNEKVHQIALFQQKTFLNGNRVANFSDSVPTKNVFLGLSHYLSKIYSDFEVPETKWRASYVDDHCSRWAPAIRNLYWFNERADGKPWKEATYYMEDAEWLISRHKGREAYFAFAAKGGHNEEPHNHNDVGHFMLHVDDEAFLKDLGAGQYTKAYFGAKRYEIICNSSKGHSVPIIDESFQRNGRNYRAEIINVDIESERETFAIEIGKAYDLPQLEKLIRTFTWIKTEEPMLLLEDIFQMNEKPNTIVERFITSALPVLEAEDGIVLQGKKLLKIQYDREQLDFTKREMEFVNHAGEREAFYALDFTVKNPQEKERIHFKFQFL